LDLIEKVIVAPVPVSPELPEEPPVLPEPVLPFLGMHSFWPTKIVYAGPLMLLASAMSDHRTPS
jgi:hypothetical protein